MEKMAQREISEVFKKWNSFLNAHPNHFIRIQNTDNNLFVRLKKQKSPTSIFLDDIKQYSDIEEWFNGVMLRDNLKNIMVTYRKKDGTASLPATGHQTEYFALDKRLQKLREQEMSQNTQTPPQQPIQQPPQPYAMPPTPANGAQGLGASVMYGMGGPAAAAHAAGMGLSDFVDLKKKAERYEELKEVVDKLKDDNHSLTLRNRELESDKKTAEKEKELALMLERSNKQSFLNSEAGQEILKILPQIAASMASGTNGQQPQASGMGIPGLSEIKERVVKYMCGESVTDQTVHVLEKLLVIQMSSPEKFNEIKQQIETIHNASNG